jgi:hypothetical protein
MPDCRRPGSRVLLQLSIGHVAQYRRRIETSVRRSMRDRNRRQDHDVVDLRSPDGYARRVRKVSWRLTTGAPGARRLVKQKVKLLAVSRGIVRGQRLPRLIGPCAITAKT